MVLSKITSILQICNSKYFAFQIELRWKNKVESSKGSKNKERHLTINILTSPKKKRSRKSSNSNYKQQYLSNSLPRSRFDSERFSESEQQAGSGEVSGRVSRNRSKKSLKSLVPCKGPGQLRDYMDYVKEGRPDDFLGTWRSFYEAVFFKPFSTTLFQFKQKKLKMKIPL